MAFPLLGVTQGKGNDDGSQKTYELVGPLIRGIRTTLNPTLTVARAIRANTATPPMIIRILFKKTIHFFEGVHALPPGSSQDKRFRLSPRASGVLRRHSGDCSCHRSYLLKLFFVLVLQAINILDDLVAG